MGYTRLRGRLAFGDIGIPLCLRVTFVGCTQATVDLRRNLRLLESLEALNILSLCGPKLIDGVAEFLKGLFGFDAVEGRLGLLFMQKLQFLTQSDKMRVVVFVTVAIALSFWRIQEISAEILT